MIRLALSLGAAGALVGTWLLAGCSSSAGSLTGGAAEVGGMKNDDPMARPVGVAWVAARAKRCGFYFDPAKLRTSYLAWERGQGGAADQYAKIESTYDTTFKRTYDMVAVDASYCTEYRGSEIKGDLQRYLGGDYSPNLPKPKVVANCGFFGCNSSDVPFGGKGFWDKYDRDHPTPY
jgi:hypothetical protein